ncbi:MAG: hypothetical protein ACYSWU_28670, partial [Planctomycetota bacterium]
MRPREVRFDVIDGRLVRTVSLHDGRQYVHRCTQAVYEAVAEAIEESTSAGVTLEPLAEAIEAPYS